MWLPVPAKDAVRALQQLGHKVFSRSRSLYTRLAERVGVVTGIESSGLIDALPLSRNREWGFRVVGLPPEEDTDETVFPHVVDPGYLPTMRTPVVVGRNISQADHEGSSRVVLLNETGARRIFGSEQDALGRRLRFYDLVK